MASKITEKDIRLGKKIKEYRKLAGITQEQLADKARLSLPFIGYLETGQKRPTLTSLKKIASALGVKVKDLIPY